jgi:hypothetical protein
MTILELPTQNSAVGSGSEHPRADSFETLLIVGLNLRLFVAAADLLSRPRAVLGGELLCPESVRHCSSASASARLRRSARAMRLRGRVAE